MTTRRDFLTGVMHVALVPVLGGIGACADEGSGTSDSLRDGGPTACSAITPTIAANHGHVLDVPLADVQAGNSKTYTLSNNGSHSHKVRVSAANFASLATGTALMLASTEDGGHTHDVTITCVAIPSTDAGQDSGSTDAGHDASAQDSGAADAGADASTSDAGQDAGTDAGQDAGPMCSDVNETIGANHGHTVMVPAADVAMGTQKTYMLSNVGHMHTLTVSAADFLTLATVGSVTGIITTAGPGHEHTITLMCI